MPRVVRIDSSCEKEVTHKKCGAVIAYFENEVKTGIHCDYGGGKDEFKYITCPHCNEDITVK